MKRAVILAVISLFPFEAAAIVRYLVQDMTCADVHEAIERDGAAILYRKASANSLPLYNRYVSSAEFCPSGQRIARASVATADTQSCPVTKCEDANRASS